MDLAPFWQQYPGAATGRWLGVLKSVMLQTRTDIAASGGPTLMLPIPSPVEVTDIGEGFFFSEDMDNVSSGLSVF